MTTANPHAVTRQQISLLHYAPAMVLLLIVVADSAQFPDTDLWGHLRFGQAAIASGHLAHRDPYSYSAAGALWRNHEWLSEIVMAAFYNAFGVVGLKLWKFSCVATTIILMALCASETAASPAIQLNTLALAAVAMVPQNQFRPQIFTFVMFSALLALLTQDNYRGRAPLWPVIPVMALWGNLHGGFIIGIATLAAYASVAGLQDLIAGRGLARAFRLSLITIAGTLATLVSPYGIDAWRVVFNALKDYAAQPIIADWQPLLPAIARGWHANPADTVFFLFGLLMMLALIVAFVREPRGGDLPLVAIAMMMTVAAFTALRNLPLAMIACAAPLARHAELIAVRRRHVPAQSTDAREVDTAASTNARLRVTPWFAASIAAVLAVVGGLFSTRLVVGPDSPVGAVAFMNRYQLHGNLLSNFGDGEYLIWHLPTSRVFIDGRYDTVYPSKVVDQYLAFINGRPDASRVLSAYPHDYVLLPADSPALRVMARAPEWKLIYRDGNWMLFARSDSPAAKIPGVPITAPPVAASFFP